KYKGLRLQSVCYLVAIRTSARGNASTIRHGERRGPVAAPVFKSRSGRDSNQDAPTAAENLSMWIGALLGCCRRDSAHVHTQNMHSRRARPRMAPYLRYKLYP